MEYPHRFNKYDRHDFELYFLFQSQNSARILWSKNLDPGDLPSRYPPDYAKEGNPGVLDGLNMTKLSRIQRSYKWQPHLPFMPVHLPNHPWAERLKYKYDTLPIQEINLNEWTLDQFVANSWYRHVEIFGNILSIWRNYLSRAPITVDLPIVQSYDIYKRFTTEKQARGYFWFYRTLVFSMYADFSFLTAGKPNWMDHVTQMFKDRNIPLEESWLNEVANILCDFRQTKRSGVIVDVASTELWLYLTRYHENGVPILMDVGQIIFRDQESPPKQPTVEITNATGPTMSWKYPKDWPTQQDLIYKTREMAHILFWDRLGNSPYIPLRPLSLSRPLVEEPGGVIHQRHPTSAWVNPNTQESVDFLQMAPPRPAEQRQSPGGLDWIKWFEDLREATRIHEKNELETARAQRLLRIKDSIKINQVHSSGPTRKSAVYKWVQRDPPPAELGWHEAWVPLWDRVRVPRKEIEDVWDEFHPSQRHYDSVNNEWDLMVLLDPAAWQNDTDYYDEDDDMQVDLTPGIDPSQPVAYFDQLYTTSSTTPYSNVLNLKSQIGFVSPSNLLAWVYSTLGLRCQLSHQPPIPFPKTSLYMGYFIDDRDKETPVYRDLEEFVSYICARDFRNPRLVELSDLHPNHSTPLDLTTGGVHINKVEISQDVVEGNLTKKLVRTGYILTPKDEASSVRQGWILVVFEATSVLQIIRNGWGRTSMESLVRHLVRHGFEFRTLTPAPNTNVQRVVHTSPELVNFVGMPSIPDIKIKRTVADYTQYVTMREELMRAPEARPAYRLGGILWRLAMEATANFDQIIDHIMDGPCEIGPSTGEYFHLNGNRFYDDSVPLLVADTICGMHGDRGCSYWPLSASWRKSRWKTSSPIHGNLMWNHRDEEWFRRRSEECITTTGVCAQPIPQSSWKKYFPSKHQFDVPFEEYCKLTSGSAFIQNDLLRQNLEISQTLNLEASFVQSLNGIIVPEPKGDVFKMIVNDWVSVLDDTTASF